MRELFVTNQFIKDLRKLPKEIQVQTDSEIEFLRENPVGHSSNVKKLKGFHNPALYRLRIGAYRVLYSFTASSLTLHRIAHRKDIYR